MEEKISDALLVFIDFLYAVVFGFVLVEVYSQVINSEILNYVQKASALFLIVGVFYFLVWDWLHGRLLTLRNPYSRYRRFFLEAVIAFAGYGAATSAFQRDVSFLVYVSIIFLLGAFWAQATRKEYPESGDRDELMIIQYVQPMEGLIIFIIFQTRVIYLDYDPLYLLEVLSLVFFGWSFVLVYELDLLERRRYTGIMRGPGVPFISFRNLERFRKFLLKFVP